jgi:hypothetical protein
MEIFGIMKAQKTFPTGNKDFAVMQPFPAAIRAEDADPFLVCIGSLKCLIDILIIANSQMCDEFGPTLSTGILPKGTYPVGWHPHLGRLFYS